jgi:hypothetical protein
MPLERISAVLCHMCSTDVKVNGELRVCFERKECWNIYELFATRFTLHRRAYQVLGAICDCSDSLWYS